MLNRILVEKIASSDLSPICMYISGDYFYPHKKEFSVLFLITNYTLSLYQEPILRATQYIPGIVQLQQQLHDLYHRRLDKTEAAQITVGDFVRGLKIGM